MKLVDALPYSPEPPIFRRPRQNLLFFHIPKTAGTSVSHFFRRRYRKNLFTGTNFDLVKPAWPNTGVYYSAHMDWMQLERYPYQTKSFTYLRDPVNQIESVYYFVQRSRHPDEALSHSGLMSRKLSFKDWLKYVRDGGPFDSGSVNGNDNMYMRCLIGRVQTPQKRLDYSPDGREMMIARDRLRRFDAIGIVEDFNRSLILICRSCNVVPPAKAEIVVRNRLTDTTADPRDEIDDETRDLLQELTVYDRALYEYGKELYGEQLVAQGLLTRD